MRHSRQLRLTPWQRALRARLAAAKRPVDSRAPVARQAAALRQALRALARFEARSRQAKLVVGGNLR
jgi:hypothetical protein